MSTYLVLFKKKYMSFIGPFEEHIPRIGQFYIKIRDNIIYAKGSHPGSVNESLRMLKIR